MVSRDIILKVIGVIVVVSAVVGGIVWLDKHDRGAMTKPEITPADKQAIQEQMKGMPMVFQKNEGQTDSTALFLVKNGSTSIYFTSSDIVFQYIQTTKADDEKTADTGKGLVLRQSFIDANTASSITGEQQLKSKVNYFIGNDKSKWVSGAPTFAQVRYAQVYPGVDLVFSGTGSKLSQTYALSAGIKPEIIQIRITGADSLEIDGNGVLAIKTALGNIGQAKPVITQEIGGKTITREATYVLIDTQTYGIRGMGLDTNAPTTISW